MLLLALALAAGTAAADTTAAGPPRDDAQAGMVAVHRQPAIPIAAVRLSVLADDPPGYAGAGHLLQHLLLPGLREQVERVGGEIQATRSTDAVVYTATGPASELEYLAGVLRSTLRPPRFGEAQMVAAARELRDERNAEWETASGHVRALLRASLFPADLSPAGTEASAERLTADVLSELWAAMYRPERVAVVAVGDVQAAQVRSAFSTLPPAPGGGLGAGRVDTVSAAPPVSPEATRGWIGLGYSATDADPATLTVAARLLRSHLRSRLPAASAEAEHWWTRQGQGLAVVVAVPPAGLAAARTAVRGSLASLAESLDATRVRDAAAGVRREMLFHARRPERMAEVVGQFIDREGDADAAQRFYDAVERVDEAAVREVLERLAERTPVVVDVPPQRLPNR
jgi:predicted Zn-dependent peptidase